MSVRSYLDHNATSPLRPEAREAMIDALDCAGNPFSLHAEGREARAIVENARETVAQIFQVMPQAVTFTSGGTEAANWLLQHRDGLKLALLAVEHPCVLKGHRFPDGDVHAIPVSPEGIVERGGNETGVIQPLSDVASLTKGRLCPTASRCRRGANNETVLGRSGKNLPWARGASRGVGLRNARNGLQE